MNNRKILLAVVIVASCTINTALAYDYVFKSKSFDDYYDATSVDVITIPAPIDTHQVIQSLPNAIYNGQVESSVVVSTPIVNLPIVKYEPKTTKLDLLKSDGSIGSLKIPAINLSVKVYDGTTEESLKNGVGHFVTSDYYEGNVCLAGHNRGVSSNFGKLKRLKIGDKISYITEVGTKRYEVSYIGKIGVEDFSRLQPTPDNKITLITCVENQPMLRLCVQAKEVE